MQKHAARHSCSFCQLSEMLIQNIEKTLATLHFVHVFNRIIVRKNVDLLAGCCRTFRSKLSCLFLRFW